MTTARNFLIRNKAGDHFPAFVLVIENNYLLQCLYSENILRLSCFYCIGSEKP